MPAHRAETLPTPDRFAREARATPRLLRARVAATWQRYRQATRAWSAEFGQQGIRVNTLAPGVILTEGSLPVKDHQELMARGFPAGRVGSPDDIAKAAVFLASDDASYMHGATLLVDGGALSTRLQ